ncbi:MAG: hypothetical protein RR919_04030 [Bacteroidales bacterium]
MQRGNLADKLFLKGGRDGMILIFSLLLAFFMWSIQKLSQDYSTYIKYKISITTSLEGRVQRAVSNDLLVVRGESSGFYILQQLYGGDEDILEINVEPKQLKATYSNPDKFYIRSSDIKTKIQEVLGSDLQVESFTTDTLYFNLPKQSYKKVPVATKSRIKYKSQYMPFGPIIIKPDSVLIYGQTLLLNSVDSVFTTIIKEDNVKTPINGLIPIEHINGIKLSVNNVYYSQEVGRYVENIVNVKVGVLNPPIGKNVAIIPQEVKLKFRTPFYAKQGYIASDFLVMLNYNDVESKGNIMHPVLRKAPKDAYFIQMEPKFVECIVN